MKLKATVSLPGFMTIEERYCLARMVSQLNSLALYNRVYDEVLTRHLRVPARNTEKAWGPAEYFEQGTDRSISVGRIIGVDVNLSGVSVNIVRADMDFWNALAALSTIYETAVVQGLSVSTQAQLYARISLDKPIRYPDESSTTSLLEKGPTIIQGLAKTPKNISQKALLVAELEALFGSKETVGLLISTLNKK